MSYVELLRYNHNSLYKWLKLFLINFLKSNVCVKHTLAAFTSEQKIYDINIKKLPFYDLHNNSAGTAVVGSVFANARWLTDTPCGLHSCWLPCLPCTTSMFTVDFDHSNVTVWCSVLLKLSFYQS